MDYCRSDNGHSRVDAWCENGIRRNTEKNSNRRALISYKFTDFCLCTRNTIITMALLTLIARSTDGLPLSSSIESDEQVSLVLTWGCM